MPPRVIKLTIVSDLICPFCYIGHYELQEAISQCANLPVQFEVEYRPFRVISNLEEDLPVDRVAFMKNKLGEQRFQNTIQVVSKWAKAQSGAAANLSFGGMMSQSTRAHRLSLKAFQVGGQRLQQTLLSSLFKAFAEDHFDIGDVNVLAQLSEETGVMSKADAITFLQSNELKAEVDKMIADSQSNGITGVPFTVIDGKWAVSGGQSSDVYVQIFKKLASTAIDSAPSPFAGPVVEATTA